MLGEALEVKRFLTVHLGEPLAEGGAVGAFAGGGFTDFARYFSAPAAA